MCLFPVFYDFVADYEDISHIFSMTVWILNILLLLYFIIELFMRNVKWTKLSHAYLMVILSMISSIISSLFFLLSNHNTNICSYGPTISICSRTLSKTFTWFLYIIRAQLVMESLDSKLLSAFAGKAPYILSIQCILMTALITIFTQNNFINSSCTVSYPLPLLICSALIGELFYGLGFMYVFYKAMTVTLQHVYDSLRPSDAANTKHQIRHHIIVYMIQLISSILFLFFVSLCICFRTLLFFEFELFISNLCLLSLFRGKVRLCKQLLIKYGYANQGEVSLAYLQSTNKPKKKHPHYSQRQISFRNLRSNVRPNKFIAQYSANSNYFLSNKWRSNAEVANIKHAINVHTKTQTFPTKAVELLGVNSNTNTINTNTNDIEIITHIDGEHHQFETINSMNKSMPSFTSHRSQSTTDLNTITHKKHVIKTRVVTQRSKHQKAKSALLLIDTATESYDINSISYAKHATNPSDRKTLMEEDFAMVEPAAIHRSSISKEKYMNELFAVNLDRDKRIHGTGLSIHSLSDPLPTQSVDYECSKEQRETFAYVPGNNDREIGLPTNDRTKL